MRHRKSILICVYLRASASICGFTPFFLACLCASAVSSFSTDPQGKKIPLDFSRGV